MSVAQGIEGRGTGGTARLAAAGPRRAALAVLGLGLALIFGAWVFELAGYAPCKLCLWQRWPYYLALPLAAAAALYPPRAPDAARGLLAATALLFLGGGALAGWHAGIEWGWWLGPAECSPGRLGAAAPMGDFLKSLETARVVRCDEAALRIAGLSLAGWNALGSFVLAGIAAAGMRARS